ALEFSPTQAPPPAHGPDYGRLIFDRIAPTYVLDTNYRIIDWNPAFYTLFAEPLALRRGMHATTFVGRLENAQEVMSRSLEVFAPGKNPLTDTELLLIPHPRYGTICTRKLAAQLFDGAGNKVAWVVNFDILSWEHGELPLFEEMSAHVESEL